MGVEWTRDSDFQPHKLPVVGISSVTDGAALLPEFFTGKSGALRQGSKLCPGDLVVDAVRQGRNQFRQ